MWIGGWSVGGLDDTPARTTCFHPSPRPICSAEGLGRWAFGAAGWPVATLFRLRSGACVQQPPSPLSSAATALSLFPRGRVSTGEVSVPTSDAPCCISAVALRVAEALAALTLQRSLWSHVRIHRHSQTADFGEWSHLGNLGS